MSQAQEILNALGGWDNLTDLQHCITRIRVDFKDDSKIDEAALEDVASRVGVDYVHSPDKSAIESHARSVLDKATTMAETRNLKDTYRYIIWPFALLLGALLAWEGTTLALRAQQLRNSHAI